MIPKSQYLNFIFRIQIPRWQIFIMITLVSVLHVHARKFLKIIDKHNPLAR